MIEEINPKPEMISASNSPKGIKENFKDHSHIIQNSYNIQDTYNSDSDAGKEMEEFVEISNNDKMDTILVKPSKSIMELKGIISHQRQTYLKQLAQFYDKKTKGAKEILLALNSRDKALLFNLTRVDYLDKVDGEYKIEELSPDTYSNHSKIDFKYGQLAIELNPFFWHGCEFAIDKKYENIDWLEKWTKKWIDEESSIPTDESGFSGAIHNVTIPTFENQITRFTVDLGTVSVDAFIELIEAISATGAKNVVINSFDLID